MCKAEGCTVTKIKGHGYCNTHYQRFKRNGSMDFQVRKHPLEDRFWRFVEKLSDAECWNWTGSKSPKGYGKLPYGNEQQAHRVSYILFKGEIPDKTMVLHHCDNPSCVNPSHLYLGDNKQNMIDMISRDRAKPRGKPPTIGKDDVMLIAESQDTVKNTARKFNTSISSVRLIKSGGMYAHMELNIAKSAKATGHQSGISNGMAKLTEETVLLIRESLESNRLTGIRYNVSASLVSMIKNRKVWSHI